MTNEDQKQKALDYFRYILQEEQGFLQAEAAVGPVATAEVEVTEPHPFLVVCGNDLLAGEMAGREVVAGQQSVVFRGNRVLEAPIAAAEEGGPMKFIGGWTREAAKALNDAVILLESQGRDASQLAVVTVPEIGFLGVWLRDQHEVAPISNPLSRRLLDLEHIYSEGELIEALRGPLLQRREVQELNQSEERRPPYA